MRERFDAIIIGGGPAGAMSALLLARQGWRVVVVERRQRNMAKTCGHCLSPRSNSLLQRVGLLDDIRRYACGATRQLRLHLPYREPMSWLLPGTGMVLSRRVLDQLLLDYAADEGAQVVQPAAARLVHVRPGDARVRVMDQEFTAGLVIGADGLRSAVARTARLHHLRQPGRKYGFSFSAPGQTDLDPGTVEMFLTPRGYLGFVRQSDGMLHGAGLVNGASAGETRSPGAFLNETAAVFNIVRQAVPGAARNEAVMLRAAGPMPCRARQAANARAALVGDAAGYIEPFTGEGMTWALHSAQLLATVTAQIKPGQWSASAAQQYCRLWQTHIGRRHLRCRLISWLLERPRLLGAVIGASAKRPEIANHLLQQVHAA